MELHCKTCHQPINAADVNLQHLVAKCLRCHSVFSFAHLMPKPPSAAASGPRPPVDMPRAMAVQNDGSSLTLTHKWIHFKHFFMVFFAILWNGFLVVWYTIALSSLGTGQEAAWMALVFPLGHVAVGLGVGYTAIAGLINVTEITAGDGWLSVIHRPLPWPGKKQIPSDDIDQLYCVEKISRGKNGVNYTYDVMSHLKSGEKVKLLSGLNEPEQALFIEQEIEKFLRISDRPVQGELPRA